MSQSLKNTMIVTAHFYSNIDDMNTNYSFCNVVSMINENHTIQEIIIDGMDSHPDTNKILDRKIRFY